LGVIDWPSPSGSGERQQNLLPARLIELHVALGKFNREPKTELKEPELKLKEPKPKNSVPDIEEPK